MAPWWGDVGRSWPRPARARALLTAVAFLAVGITVATTDSAAEAGEPLRVEIVGDSLLRMTYESEPIWHIRARDGRSMHGSQRLLALVGAGAPDVLVVALGSNDVRLDLSLAAMTADLARAARNTASVPCVVFTTVTPFGTPFYNRHWAQAAARWNRAVGQVGAGVANWSREVRLHREFLLDDGVHLTSAGSLAYDRLLREAVDQLC